MEHGNAHQNLALELLREWGRANGEPGTGGALRAFLQQLALRYIDDAVRSIMVIACELLNVQLRPKEPRKWVAVKALLEAAGLFLEVNTDRPRFLHATFAEFLAAPEFTRAIDAEDGWFEGLMNPDSRIQTIFAFDHLSVERRRELVAAMVSRSENALACGWIAAEGLSGLARVGRRRTRSPFRTLPATVTRGVPCIPVVSR